MNGLIVPNHLGVILDGNRRWSKKRHMPLWFGHIQGARTFDKFIDWCMELGIPNVSIYALSTENLNRTKREVEEIFKIFYEWLEKYEKKESGFFDKYEVRVKFVGNLSKFPSSLVRLMGRLMQRTAKYQKKCLNILVAYGSQFELMDTFKKIAKEILETGKIEITEKSIEKNLSVPVPLELIIRTGGMSRLSNFMLWQASYSEFYVTKTLWPDFTKKELIKAIRWYNSVKRNFGE